jgi:hypothetical protein
LPVMKAAAVLVGAACMACTVAAVAPPVELIDTAGKFKASSELASDLSKKVKGPGDKGVSACSSSTWAYP